MQIDGKMISRYKFSQESYPNLLKFIEKSQLCKGSTNIDSDQWEKILPKNDALLKNIQKLDESEVEEIASESLTEIPKEVNLTSLKELTLIEESMRENKCIEDVATVIIQQLKADGCITNEIFTLSPIKIEELFRHLSDININSEHIDLLGQFLISNRKMETDTILKYFCKYLLIVKLKQKEEEHVKRIFLSILNICPTIVCTELANCCIEVGNEECPRALLENLKNLQSIHKEQLLREFVLNCSKLEKGHFTLLESLVENQVDMGILKKMMDMFSASANEFSTNKSFGKLMVHIMQKITSQICHFESDIQNIVSNHKSPWRSKMMKLFESNSALLSENTMSQIML